ncbi:ATP-dependent DNA helicase [Trichonephila inaurata madagascariensis]|uniref:ATP-dependent DNA helicase n=1 Tax=Trichonephila inaurata madagascariensis TaxID=2747483 RepID=A0A8X7CB19_9ARAC|nr:ATP-dependent DNA helicase [Trichonephila inaurata madagascariensis]
MGKILNRFLSLPTSLWPPPAKSSAPCACSESWVHSRENFTKQKRNALSSFATVMPMRKRGSLGRKTVQSKAVEHTGAAEAHDEKSAGLQADQVHHSLARVAETPEQYHVRLQSQQFRQNASRAAETPEQRQSRLQEDQVRHRVARAAETPIQHVVYPNIQQNFKDQDWLSHRAILASRNDMVEKLKVTIQKQLPRQEYAYKSIDCILNDDEAVQYQFLNSNQTPDLQAHNLILKDVLTGCAKGEDVFIPRIPIIPSDNTIQFKRMQFPLKLCLEMTINKSQSQSLRIAGIDLQTPCFSHGQLYVACSRVGKEESLFVHTPNGTARNVIYHIALR